MPPLTSLQSADIQSATGATRNEIINWRNYLSFPPENDAPGKAMRYSLINGIEYALLKACVARGVPHDVAAKFIRDRLTLAISRADRERLSLTSSVISNPAEWLEGSEFDVVAQPWLTPDPMGAAAFWVFEVSDARQTGEVKWICTSLHDKYLSFVEWAPMFQKRGEERGIPLAENIEARPLDRLKDLVVYAVAKGSVVIEIRNPIRKFYAHAYGTTFIPGDRRVMKED